LRRGCSPTSRSWPGALADLGVQVSQSWPSPEELPNAREELEKLFVMIRDGPIGYRPTAHGREIARRVRPEIVAEKCPRFRAFIENLKRTAGLPVES
jgi:hypothetical protein